MTVRYEVTAGERPDFAVPLSSPPITVTIPARKRPIFALLYFGGVWLFGAVVLAFSFAQSSFLVAIFTIGAFVVGVTLIVVSLPMFGGKNVMTFEGDRVVVREGGSWRKRTWEAPYRTFSAVRLREKSVKDRKGQTVTYQIIELVHRDPLKTLPLYVRQETTPPRERLARYAHLFDLPAEDETETEEETPQTS